MRFVVGLGNPGEQYRRNRHNAGFMVVDVLAARGRAPRGHTEGDAWVSQVQLAGEDVLLVKPQTFMNRSGVAVGRVLAAWSGAPADLVVVEDDVALELGTLRVRERGGHGGHNGLRSVIDVLGTDEFPRVRLGIRKGELPADLAGYVLSDFPEDEVLVVQEAVGGAADAIECLIREGAAAAMDRWNGPKSR
jgi:PTH1 family peptidyl-tRNA hydrolase